MKITKLPYGLMKLQAETRAESQAVCGILEIIFHFNLPDVVCNNHGMARVKGQDLNWCVIPDGSLTGPSVEKLRPGIETRIKVWARLPWNLLLEPDMKPVRRRPARKKA